VAEVMVGAEEPEVVAMEVGEQGADQGARMAAKKVAELEARPVAGARAGDLVVVDALEEWSVEVRSAAAREEGKEASAEAAKGEATVATRVAQTEGKRVATPVVMREAAWAAAQPDTYNYLLRG